MSHTVLASDEPTCQKPKNTEQYQNKFSIGCLSEGMSSFLRLNPAISGKGYMNAGGKIIIPPTYSLAEDFHQGRAIVSNDKHQAVIDKTGKLIVPFKYDEITNFNQFGLASIQLNDEYGSIDSNGKIVLPIAYDSRIEFHDDLARVQKKGTVGYIDKTAKTVIPLKYGDLSQDFHNGIAVVALNSCPIDVETTCQTIYGAINKEGKAVLPFEYYKLDDFTQNVSIATNRQGTGAVDKTGKVIIPFIYNDSPGVDTVSKFTNGYSVVRKNVGNADKYGAYDEQGNIVIPFEYDHLADFNEQGYVVAVKQGKVGIIDKYNKVSLPFGSNSLEHWTNNLFLITTPNHERTGLIDNTGKEIIPIDHYANFAFSNYEASFFKEKGDSYIVYSTRTDGKMYINIVPK